MKKLLLLAVFSLVCYASSFAQVRVGGMLGYGTEVEQWGLGVNAEFFLNEKMAIAPNLLFYFPEKRNGLKFSYWELNGNFHYYLLSEDAVSIYGLAGLNLITIKVKATDDFLDDYDNSESELGLNLGLGVNFKVGGVLPFGELKYVAGDADQAVLLLGVKFPISE
jgi:outer membrane immunogenic protein